MALTSPFGTVASLCVAPLIDKYGVRIISIVSLGLSAATHTLLAVGRSRLTLVIFLCIPAEAPLGLALFTIAIKDLTTARTRATAFAVSSTLLNTGIVASLNGVEALRRVDVRAFGLNFSGLRLCVVAAVAMIVMELVLVAAMVRDVRVVAREPSAAANGSGGGGKRGGSGGKSGGAHGDDGSGIGEEASLSLSRRAVAAMSTLRSQASAVSLFAITARAAPPHNPHAAGVKLAGGMPAAPSLPAASIEEYVVESKQQLAECRPRAMLRAWCALARGARFWRVVLFDVCMLGARNQWAQMSTLMITYLTRAFGEATPVYAIRAINPTVNTAAPALLAPFFAHLPAFAAMLPPLWIFAASSLPMAVTWMGLSGLAEAVWAPRSRAWTTEMAPTGHEAVFLTAVGLVPYLPKLGLTVLNGWLNEEFAPNCRACRDSVGHFCADAQANGGCASTIGEHCEGLALLGSLPRADATAVASCPRTCAECPGWEARPHAMFGVVLAMSLSSPLLVTLALPLLQGVPREEVDLL